ncbi:MAG TPA: cupin domain-containing protein [Burkholderiales bacterium]|nr:cupin domain-containing protein [Burkholderiales bacterium]
MRQASGVVSTLVWVTDETPADIAGEADRAAREIGVPPPASGTVFRVVDFPPEQGVRSREAILREMGIAPGGTARHPGMHRTKSVDYAIVVEGEIDMLLEDAEIHLHAGDVLVQQGTDHAWVNRGDAPCRIAFVLVDAREFPAA